MAYENPCEVGAPASDADGAPETCGADADCPDNHTCTRSRRTGTAVCCPEPHYVDNTTETDVMEVKFTRMLELSLMSILLLTSCRHVLS